MVMRHTMALTLTLALACDEAAPETTAAPTASVTPAAPVVAPPPAAISLLFDDGGAWGLGACRVYAVASCDRAIRKLRTDCKARTWSACHSLAFTLIEGVAAPLIPYERGAWAEGMQVLESACEAGDAGSCYLAAERYRRGHPLGVDLRRARKLDQRACDDNYADACARLGKASVEPPGGPAGAEAGAKAADGGSGRGGLRTGDSRRQPRRPRRSAQPPANSTSVEQ